MNCKNRIPYSGPIENPIDFPISFNHHLFSTTCTPTENKIIISKIFIQGCLGNTGLHLSVGKGYKTLTADGRCLTRPNIDITRALLARGTNSNLPNREGNTPLHLACARRDVDSIQALVAAGANPDLLNKDNLTARQLLEIPYETAVAILNNAVAVFLLDKNEHASNLASATAALTARIPLV